jgi:hypothetical protein
MPLICARTLCQIHASRSCFPIRNVATVRMNRKQLKARQPKSRLEIIAPIRAIDPIVALRVSETRWASKGRTEGAQFARMSVFDWRMGESHLYRSIAAIAKRYGVSKQCLHQAWGRYCEKRGISKVPAYMEFRNPKGLSEGSRKRARTGSDGLKHPSTMTPLLWAVVGKRDRSRT